MDTIILLGSPNVGKSALFHRLTGQFTTVSNYPGTTVEIAQAVMTGYNHKVNLVDTPGLYSLYPLTEEEKVTRQLLGETRPRFVVHVVDGKNLERMLPLTLQLIEAGTPVILVVNMLDEVENQGIFLDLDKLRQKLGIPVIGTSCRDNRGIACLKRYLLTNTSVNSFQAFKGLSLSQENNLAKYLQAQHIAKQVVQQASKGRKPYTIWDQMLISPIPGIPIALLVIYFALYRIVGIFGGGYLVDLLDTQVFEALINPAVQDIVQPLVSPPIYSLLAGEYGVITLAVRYAVAIILPVVGIFFLMFSMLEDSGYLPRLSLLLDKTLKLIGLSGRGAIPLVLGLGCGTMATVVTRTLETKRERYVATFLLALAVPCSAQLGLFLALLADYPLALLVWVGAVGIMFLWAGSLLTLILPGAPPRYSAELPPLRAPTLKGSLAKTWARMKWYLTEVLPIFVGASILIWITQLSGLFTKLMVIMEHAAQVLGLPAEVAPIFLFGFFRRDYGAAGLYDLQADLTWQQLAITSVTLTLFVPCIAQLSVMIKERGWFFSLLSLLVIMSIAFGVGFLLRLLLI